MALFDCRVGYLRLVLGDRAIPAAAITALVHAGDGKSVAEGNMLYQRSWFEPNGERWTLFALARTGHGGDGVVSGWLEHGPATQDEHGFHDEY